MSLFKQVFVLFSLLIVAILVTVMALNVSNDKQFLSGQLQSNAQNTAISLSASLSEALKNNDLILAESLIDAIYDSGYYEYIKLYDSNNTLVVHKHKNLTIKDVPSFFVTFIEFHLESAKADISNGWSKIGYVEVKNHEGFAYYKLWETFISLLQSIIVIFCIYCVFFFVGLRFLLASLVRIKEQALAITKHNFHYNNDIPFTLEFRSVVVAMNAMVAKVEEIFNKETEYLNKYNNLLYKDPLVPQMGNRRFFVMKLSEVLDNKDKYSTGIFIFLTLSDLSVFKAKEGFPAMRVVLNDFARIILEIEQMYEESFCAKMNESDFALIIPHHKMSEIKQTLELKLHQSIVYLQQFDHELKIYGAVIEFASSDTQKIIFSKADNLLAKAKHALQSHLEYGISSSSLISFGKEEWVNIVKSLGTHNEYFKLVYQPVINVNTNTVHSNEIFIRFACNGALHAAGQIMPIMKELDLMNDIDRFVIQSLTQYIAASGTEKFFAINIDSKFLRLTDNLHWLEQLIAINKEFANHISFEASLQDISANFDIFQGFVEMLKKVHVRFGVDNFYLTSNFDYMKALKPSYIKVDKNILFDIMGEENSGILNSLHTIVGAFDIQIIATSVETSQEKANISDKSIAFMQGRNIAEIEFLEQLG